MEIDSKKSLAAFLADNFEADTKRKQSFTQTTPTFAHHEVRPRSLKKIVVQNYSQIMEMEKVIVKDLIMPLIFIMKYALPYHDTITYDCAEKRFETVKGSMKRKTLCILWEVTVLYRLAIKVIPGLNFGAPTTSESSDSSGLSEVAKGAYFVFITFNVVMFHSYWTKTKNACEIFNDIIGLSGKLHLSQKSPPRVKAVKCVAHLAWIYILGYVLLSVALYLINIFLPELAGIRMQRTFPNGTVIVKGMKRSSLNFNEIHTTDDILVIQIVTATASFINIFGWMMNFTHFGVWSVLFRQLMMIFYWRIDAMRELGHYFVIPHEIRTFNRIGMIIEKYNAVYGLGCLFGAIVYVVYISTSLKHVVSGVQSILQMSVGIHLVLSYVPMSTAAFLAAEVQRVAGNFAGIMKEEYGKFTKECGDAAESLCGIAIVHYDLSTTNIGLKGTGFFTVSYQFITTIASLIFTYSVLVVQLFPHDNESIEV